MSELSVISGDDIVFNVDFCFENGDSFDFSDGKTAEMLLHFGNTEEIFKPISYENNIAQFYLSGADTKRLFEANPSGVFYICVKVVFPDGTQNTPIYRKPFFIERC